MAEHNGYFRDVAMSKYCRDWILDLEQQLAERDKTIAKLRECVEGAHKYLKATYDLHTWKDEPEYAMMKDFEQCLAEIDADKLRADIKSVNFSYWKKCEELSELQEQSSNLFNEAKKIFEEYHDQIFYYREELPASWLTIAEKSAKWIDSIWLRSKD